MNIGKAAPEDEYRSQEEYRQRAAMGDPEALFYLAWDYFKGRLVAKDVQMDGHSTTTAIGREIA